MLHKFYYVVSLVMLGKQLNFKKVVDLEAVCSSYDLFLSMVLKP